MLFEKLFDPNALWLNFPADILNECYRENNRNECSRKLLLELKIDSIFTWLTPTIERRKLYNNWLRFRVQLKIQSICTVKTMPRYNFLVSPS